MKKLATAVSENAVARKALESLAQIEEEAQELKAAQLDGLREALGNIQLRIDELEEQRRQVNNAIAQITGTTSVRKLRGDHGELRGRVLRWLAGHAGTWYHAAELQKEFPELESFASVAVFLKKAIDEGVVKVDKSGGNRNTRYSAVG